MELDRFGYGSVNVHRTLAEENAAKRLCFADCSAGVHLDFEAGVCGVCRSEGECGSWVPYLGAARAAKSEDKS